MIEASYGNKLITALFTEDAVLQALLPDGVKVFNTRRPRNGPRICIIFSLVSGDDVHALPAERVMVNASYMIEAVGTDVNEGDVKPIADRFDDILEADTSAVVDGSAYVGKFVRTNVTSRSEVFDNVWWTYLGGVYDVVIYRV